VACHLPVARAPGGVLAAAWDPVDGERPGRWNTL
jgi:hypothetical protein